MADTQGAARDAKRHRALPVHAIAASLIVLAIILVAGIAILELADRPEDSVDEARESLESGDYKSAEERLSALVAKDGDNLEARAALALALAAQGKNEEAQKQYAAIVKTDPRNDDALARMAALEQLLGQASQAIAHLEAAIAVQPEPSYLASVAPIYATMGKWTECIDAWTKYLELAELDPAGEGEVHAAMAYAYDGMREYDKAKAELEQALFLDPNNAQYKSRLEGYTN